MHYRWLNWSKVTIKLEPGGAVVTGTANAEVLIAAISEVGYEAKQS